MSDTTHHYPAPSPWRREATAPTTTPSLLSRLSRRLQEPTPDFRQRLRLRRFGALALVALAAVVATGSRVERVPVATREIPAGTQLQMGDVEWRAMPAGTAPHDLPDAEGLAGAITAHGLVAGDIVTGLDIMGSHLTNTFVSTNTKIGESQPGNMVPLRLADPTLAPLLHHGDVVDIVTAAENEPAPRVIAAGGTIISTVGDGSTGSTSSILVALPEADARAVAATALHTPLAVVITGPRAHAAR
ncbi:hypothetical protein C1Y63_08595 [Corynebacterium sp. 13CS0277]|uniref:SAF domain-containing protein n=1 Tax=Corynebacterium sp. 13CS0277 TaxID=2071994 RepID=UPI000D029074|nr:SAF domain-containing protein [Corynebacterium sp. 13CS0277]PRQ11041.1 hypothetical protein C1Y63_08595 [Corynebacterium sp. 13CS0277]